MEQHPLGRIDPESGEQFGIAQRQFDHLAQLLDRILHTADVVVIDRSASACGLLELGAQLDLGVLVDMDDALGRGRDHGEAYLGERIGGRIEHPPHFGGHVLDRLLAGGGDQIARYQGLAEEIALERLGRALEPHLAAGGREDHPGRGARFGRGDLDMLARAALGIAALQPVEPDHVERLILVIGGHGERDGVALSRNLDDIALGDAERLEGGAREAGDALAAFLLPGRRHLKPDGLLVDLCFRICHARSRSFASVEEAQIGCALHRCNRAGARWCPKSVRVGCETRTADRKKPGWINRPGLEVLGEDA